MACTPQKRLDRLERNYPFLFPQDTTNEILVSPKIIADTSVFLKKIDSFTIYRDRAFTTVIRTHDSFYAYMQVDPCTTFVQTVLPRNLENPAKKRFQDWLIAALVVISLLTFLLIRTFRGK